MTTRRPDLLIRLIGAFKLVKAAALVAIGIGALSMIRDQDLRAWIGGLAKDVENRHLVDALGAITNVKESRLREIELVSFAYAALFVVEGVGLLKRRVWAEYVTIVITTSFVPLEIYELVERASLAKALITVANFVIVGYLVWRLRRDRQWPFRHATA